MTTPNQERRRYVRLPMEDNMMVRYGHRGLFNFGSCRDLSPGGLFIATKTPAPFGSEITIKFTLPGHEQPLNIQGKVVRVHRDTRNRTTTKTPGMNVHFTKMGRQTEENLKSYLAPKLRQLVIQQLAERNNLKAM